MKRMSEKKERPRIGLALSGGAARGIAHIGVLEVLARIGITPVAVAGTSVGSIIGALYCSGMDHHALWRISENIGWGKLIQPSFSGLGLVKTDRLEKLIREIIGDRLIEDLEIPFAAVAVDITSGERIVFREGPVAHAVRASSSIPAIFEPVIDGDQALVDGGVADNLPTALVREMGADAVIAVDLNAQPGERSMPVNIIDVTFRSFAALMWNTSEHGRDGADVLIQPAISHIGYHDLGRAADLYAAGVAAAEAAVDAITALTRPGEPASV